MKEECKNCKHAQPTYKGIRCNLKNKKVKTNDTCKSFISNLMESVKGRVCCNCIHAKPYFNTFAQAYTGIRCNIENKNVKSTDTCTNFKEKR